MKVVEDKFTVLPFRVRAVCSHCRSVIELNELKDLRPTTRTAGSSSYDFCEEVAFCFRCPLCAENTTLPNEIERKIPASVASVIAKKKAV